MTIVEYIDIIYGIVLILLSINVVLLRREINESP